MTHTIGRPRRGPWAWAAVLALLLHVGAISAIRGLDVLAPRELAAAEPELVEVVFEPLPPDPPRRVFTEQPAVAEEPPPEDTDLLSNVDARARDDVPGGEGLPRQLGDADVPQVALVEGSPDATPTPPPVPEQEPPTDPRDETAPGEPGRVAASAELLAERVSEHARSLMTPQAAAQRRGNSDISQPASAASATSARLPGDIQLSTTRWDFAPWVQGFRRKVLDVWMIPSGHAYGLIHGWTRVALEVGARRIAPERGGRRLPGPSGAARVQRARLPGCGAVRAPARGLPRGDLAHRGAHDLRVASGCAAITLTASPVEESSSHAGLPVRRRTARLSAGAV